MMILKNLPPLSRRSFLKKTSLAGLTAALPTWLSGCGGDDDDESVPAASHRERRTLHFDFSGHPDMRDVRLMALLSDSHKRLLTPHTNETRDRFRQENPLLATLEDADLTHYIEAVDLPANALQTLMTFGTRMDTGDTVLCSAHIHIPQASLTAFAERALTAGAEPLDKRLFEQYRARHPGTARALAAALADINDLATWDDLAAFLVFHHPEIINLDADSGCEILQRIYSLPCADDDSRCFPFLTELADDLEDLGCASTTPGGWATLVPQTRPVFDDNGELIPQGDGFLEEPMLDDDDQQVFGYAINDEIKDSLGDVVRQVLKSVFDDESLAGNNWHALDGLSTLRQEANNPTTGNSGFKVQATSPKGTVLHGVEMTDLVVKDSLQREVEIQLRNWHLRFVNVHVEFFRDDPEQRFQRKPLTDLPLPQSPQDTERAMFLRTLPTSSLAGAIAQGVGPDFLKPDPLPVSFMMPSGATGARLYFGSLGVGGDPFCPEALGASMFTLIFNLGLPALFLALGVGTGIQEIVDIVRNADAATLAALDFIGKLLIGAEGLISDAGKGIFISGLSDNLVPFLAAVGTTVVKLLASIFGPRLAAEIGPLALQLLERIAAAVGKSITLGAASSAIPIANIVILVLSTAAALAPITLTVVEVLANPAIFHNDVKLTLDTRLTLVPQDATFALAATRYLLTARYTSGLPRTLEGTVQGGSATPIQTVLSDVPSGGEVGFEVSLFSADGCIVGTGSFGPVPNFPDTAGEVRIGIEQRALPMTANTRYRHQFKLATDNGQRVWQPTTTPPTTVQGSLNDSGLSALNDLTVQTRSANVGYGFQAAGQGIGSCDGGAGGLLHSFQNLSSATDGQGDQGLQFSGCGFREPTALVYDPQGTASQPGRNFFIRPLDAHFHVMSLVPGQGPVNTAQTLSWGRFTNAPTSLALHPQGHLVAVSREFHKMEILQLPEQAVSLADAPDAVPFAVLKAGLGGRPGLLDTPVAVTVHQGTILVLERGSELKGFRRIQAFDASANPVMQFADGSSNILPLPEDGSEYLDIGVDGLGYIFLLNAINGGRSPSDYRLDVYDPEGVFVTRTTGVAAGRMAVSLFRDVVTLNFETLIGSTRTEPTLSQWVPVTPGGCG